MSNETLAASKEVIKTKDNRTAVHIVRRFGKVLFVVGWIQLITSMFLVCLIFFLLPDFTNNLNSQVRDTWETMCEDHGSIEGDECKGQYFYQHWYSYQEFYSGIISGTIKLETSDETNVAWRVQLLSLIGYTGGTFEPKDIAMKATSVSILTGILGIIFGWLIKRYRLSAKGVAWVAIAVILINVCNLLFGSIGLLGIILIIFAIITLPHINAYDDWRKNK